MRITIAPKLFIGFLVVIFLNVFFFVIVSKLDDLNGIANIVKHQNIVKNDLSRLKGLHNVQGLSAYSYERIGKEESVLNFHEINKSISSLIDTLAIRIDTIRYLDSLIATKKKVYTTEPSFNTLSEMTVNVRNYNKTFNATFDSLVILKSATDGSKDNRLSGIHEVFDDADKKFTSELDAAQALINDQTNLYIKEVQIRIFNVKQVVLIILAGMSLFSIVFALVFSRAITTSLRRLRESAKAIAKGDFEFNPAGYPHDEIGDLAKALHGMALDLKNAQEELVRSKRLAAIGEIVASVNHEINNPLMIISGNAQFLEMSMEGYPEEMRERVTAILEETERISRVTRKLREIKNPVVEDYTSSGEQMINLDKSAS